MPSTPLPSLHVLIVDDNFICSNILARAITSQQLVALHVTTLSSAEEALRDLSAARYDIIFTDIEMGGMSGDSMARKIRETDREIPIHAVTARCDDESLERYRS